MQEVKEDIRISATTVRSTPHPEELVCETARSDYMQEPAWQQDFEHTMKAIEGKDFEEKKRELIEMLMMAGHWGPFEHPVITLGIENMSRVTLAQITRHRIASFDIQSGRFARMHVENFAVPPSYRADEVVSRKGGKKKITMDKLDRWNQVDSLLRHAFAVYDDFRKAGVPVEDARYILPEGITIHGHMTVNARSLMHVIALRTFGDAQWEIRHLMKDFLREAKKWMPITFELFEKKYMNKRTTIAP